MEYRTLGPSDLRVSSVGMGTWALGNDFFGTVDDKTSVSAIQAALDAGVNLIDTAPSYGAGHAEEVVGRALRGRRDAAVLATKVGIHQKGNNIVRTLRPDSVRQELDDSLRRLQVDSIDLYQIHWPDPATPLDETLEALEKLQQSGKFRYLGVSNVGMAYMDQVRERMRLVSLQPHYSLIHRGIEKRILSYCQERNLGVISYGTLAGGILTGKFREIPQFKERDHRDHFYGFFKEPLWSRIQEFLPVLREIAGERGVTVSQVAINWTTAQTGITSVLVGAKHPEQARSNGEAAMWSLSREELERIDTAHRRTLGAAR